MSVPDNWEFGPKFGKNPMKKCPYCDAAMTGSSTFFCQCGAEWGRTGSMLSPPVNVPDGCLLVWEDEKLMPGDVLVWDGMAIRKGNVIEF